MNHLPSSLTYRVIIAGPSEYAPIQLGRQALINSTHLEAELTRVLNENVTADGRLTVVCSGTSGPGLYASSWTRRARVQGLPVRCEHHWWRGAALHWEDQERQLAETVAAKGADVCLVLDHTGSSPMAEAAQRAGIPCSTVALTAEPKPYDWEIPYRRKMPTDL